MLFIVLTSKSHGINGSDNGDEEGDDKGGDDKEGIPPNQQEDEPEEDEMQIFVKFCFDSNKTITLEVDSDDTIGTIKKYIKNKESIPRNDQRLLFKGGDLEDGKTLSDYKIKTQATLYLFMRGEGGAKRGREVQNNSSKKEDFLATQLMKAERALDKPVSNPLCVTLMQKARELKDNGPATPVDFVAVFNLNELRELSEFLDGVDKNGGRAMLQLLPMFIKEVRELDATMRDLSNTKHALVETWALKYCEHFMTDAGTIMTNNLVKAVEKHSKELKKKQDEDQKRSMNDNTVAQRAQEVAVNAIQDPATLAQILQANPQLMQVLMQAGVNANGAV